MLEAALARVEEGMAALHALFRPWKGRRVSQSGLPAAGDAAEVDGRAVAAT
jgi:hypothetical protein